jgi:proteasome accessory factor C
MARANRLLDLLKVLAGSRKAMNYTQLARATGIRRTALYELLRKLKNSGVLEEIQKGQNKLFRLSASLALGLLSKEQIAALVLAGQAMNTLKGTRLARDLDSLIRPLAYQEEVQALLRLAPPSPLVNPQVFNMVLEAWEKKRRLRCLYQGSQSTEARWRTVDPLLFYADGDQPYLDVFDLDIQEERTFKLIRLQQVELLEQPAASYPARTKRHARKVWNAPLVEVIVRLSPEKARFAHEWPLAREGQQLLPQDDGAVLVKAQLAGTAEALKWVLSWGDGAWVLAPTELREAHLRELQGALSGYQHPRNDPS